MFKNRKKVTKTIVACLVKYAYLNLLKFDIFYAR